MASTQASSEGEDYSKYSAFDDAGVPAPVESTTFAMQSKTAAASMSLADVRFGNDHVQRNKPRKYSRDEFLYALSSPSSVGAMAWMLSSFVAIIYGSSIIVYLNFVIPLFLGPYIIKEEMPAQLLPSVRRKFNKLRAETTELQIKNIQLKGTVSRMQRQEYRLSAAEERFEHLCRRSDKDIAKMKQLARKNAALRNKIKVNLAGKKLQDLLTRMLQTDVDENHRISEKKIFEAVQLMEEFAGKKTFATVDKEIVHQAIVSSLAKNLKNTHVSEGESDSETRDSLSGYDDVREAYNTQNDSSEASSSNVDTKSYGVQTVDTSEVESRAVSSKKGEIMTIKLEPSGHVQPSSKEVYGTADRPIDIEKLLFQNRTQKLEAE